MKIKECPSEIKKYAVFDVRINISNKSKTVTYSSHGVLISPNLVLTVRHSIERVIKDACFSKINSTTIEATQDGITRFVKKIKVIDSLSVFLEQQCTENLDMALLEIEKPGFASSGLLHDNTFNGFWAPKNLKEVYGTAVYWFNYTKKGISYTMRSGIIVDLAPSYKGPVYIIKGDRIKKGMSGSSIYTFDGKFVGLFIASRKKYNIFGFKFCNIKSFAVPAVFLTYLLKSNKIFTINS